MGTINMPVKQKDKRAALLRLQGKTDIQVNSYLIFKVMKGPS